MGGCEALVQGFKGPSRQNRGVPPHKPPTNTLALTVNVNLMLG